MDADTRLVDGDGTQVQLDLRLPGQIYDVETGLHYNRHRVYDPKTGRYLEADPIGQAGGVDMYSYASAQPTEQTDPSGLDPTAAVAITLPIPSLPAPPPVLLIGAAGAARVIAGLEVNDAFGDDIQRFLDETFGDECPDQKAECEKQYQNDLSVCRAIGRRGQKKRASLCYASALERKIACELGKPLPPLITWNN